MQTSDLSEIRALVQEAYIYGFPMVDSYRIQHAYFVDTHNPEYKAPWNQLCNIARVFTPADKAVQTPNSDTPYSMLGLDLRTEPMVLTVPSMEKERYFSIQLIDLYTFNFDYIGSRTTGNDGGSFLIAGPNWQGEIPNAVKKVIRSETELALATYRTQLFNPADLDQVKQIQAQYQVQPLSAFLGQPTPQQATDLHFIAPLTPQTQKTSLEFFNILNFVLQFCPTHPSEQDLMARFAKIDVGAGMTFVTEPSSDVKGAIAQGIADAWQEFQDLKKRIDAKEVTSGNLFGTREDLNNNYLHRMAAAIIGIYGNSRQEAIHPIYSVDADGQPLSGANNYTLHFSAEQLPPVNAFWSVTMYELPASLLVANSMNRYLLNSPMLPQFKREGDGSITFYIQNLSPGAELAANWLPAPQGSFICVMRLYWPKSEAIDGTWQPPAMQRVK